MTYIKIYLEDLIDAVTDNDYVAICNYLLKNNEEIKEFGNMLVEETGRSKASYEIVEEYAAAANGNMYFEIPITEFVKNIRFTD